MASERAQQVDISTASVEEIVNEHLVELRRSMGYAKNQPEGLAALSTAYIEALSFREDCKTAGSK